MAKIQGIGFIYVFVGCLIGLIFASPINTLFVDIANNTTGITSTIYSYGGVIYALCVFLFLVGSMAGFMRTNRN